MSHSSHTWMWEAITIVEFVNPFSKHSHTIGEINRGGLNIAVCFGLIHLSLYYILEGFYFDFLVTSAYHRELNEPMNCTVFNCCTWLIANQQWTARLDQVEFAGDSEVEDLNNRTLSFVLSFQSFESISWTLLKLKF